jgi:hypothetical protein
MLPEDLPYRVVCVDGHDEVLLRAGNLHIGRATYETARHLFPKDNIQYRNGAQIIARSDRVTRSVDGANSPECSRHPWFTSLFYCLVDTAI